MSPPPPARAHAQEELRCELPLQLPHVVQQHYILDAGNGLLATMMVVMRRRMNIMVAVMVRYLAAAKGGVRMGSEQLLLLSGRRMLPPGRHRVVAGQRRDGVIGRHGAQVDVTAVGEEICPSGGSNSPAI